MYVMEHNKGLMSLLWDSHFGVEHQVETVFVDHWAGPLRVLSVVSSPSRLVSMGNGDVGVDATIGFDMILRKAHDVQGNELPETRMKWQVCPASVHLAIGGYDVANTGRFILSALGHGH